MPSNRLVNASQAARCQHLKVNGLRCGSPARHGRDFCCFHDSATRRNREFVLPIVEDCASLQLALNKIMQALLDKLIDRKTATTLLYALQIAFANLKQLKGEQRVDDYERGLQARLDVQRRPAVAAPPPHAPAADPVSASPAHAIADPPPQIAPDSIPAVAAAGPAPAPDPVNECNLALERANQKSQIAKEKVQEANQDSLIAKEEKEPRFDIQAYAEEVPSFHTLQPPAPERSVPKSLLAASWCKRGRGPSTRACACASPLALLQATYRTAPGAGLRRV